MSKVVSLAEAAALVEDGSTLAVGGLSTNSAPMAFVREVARRGVRDLTVVAVVSGLAVDWLVAAGCVRTVVTGLVGLEGYGLAPAFRRAAEAGEIEVEEYSEHLLICRLQAAAYGLPFVPTRAGLGTDVVGLHPQTTRVERDPVTGRPYVACAPLRPDVAVVHVHEADPRGYGRVNPRLVWFDDQLVKAARTTVLTAERIVHPRTFEREPGRTTYPRFAVHAVAEAPFGCYPCSCYPEYAHHERFYQEYAAAARDPEAFKRFCEERVFGPPDQAAFLAANGGARTILDILGAP